MVPGKLIEAFRYLSKLWHPLPDVIEIIPKLIVGNNYRLEIKQRLGRQLSDNTSTVDEMVAQIDLQIAEVSDSGFVLFWQWQDMQVNVLINPSPQQKLGRQLLSLARDLRFELRFDPEGRFRDLANFAAIREQAWAWVARESALDSAVEPILSRAEAEAVRKFFDQPAMVKAVYLKEAFIYCSAFCRSFRGRESTQLNTSMANPYGGATLEVLEIQQLRSYRPWSHSLRFVLERKLDSSALNQIMAAMGRQFNIAEPAKHHFLHFYDFTHCHLDIRSGLPLRLDWERTVSAAGYGRSETLHMQLLKH